MKFPAALILLAGSLAAQPPLIDRELLFGDPELAGAQISPDGNAAPGADVPPARNITEAKGVVAQIVAVPKSDPDLIYVGLNDRDKAWHDLYKIKISTGERTLMRKNTDRIGGWVFDVKDQLRLAVRS